MKKSTVIKRIKAFLIDYLIILIYIGLLFGATVLVAEVFDFQLTSLNPVTAELIGVITLTLPVILYFTISENGKSAGTIGKRKMGLRVTNRSLNKADISQLIFRNCIKFLPWELAHFFIYRLFYFDSTGETVPNWVMTGLITAQGLALIYLLCLLFTKNNRSVYEMLSGTRVIQTNE